MIACDVSPVAMFLKILKWQWLSQCSEWPGVGKELPGQLNNRRGCVSVNLNTSQLNHRGLKLWDTIVLRWYRAAGGDMPILHHHRHCHHHHRRWHLNRQREKDRYIPWAEMFPFSERAKMCSVLCTASISSHQKDTPELAHTQLLLTLENRF